MPKKITLIPFLIMGILVGSLLALFDHFKINNPFLNAFICFYAYLFLFAYPVCLSLRTLFLSTAIAAILAAIPYSTHYYALDLSLPAFLLSAITVYAINVFHLHYHQKQFQWDYAILFHGVWDSFIKISIAFLFTGLCWFIVAITAYLFGAIGFIGIRELVTQDWFVIMSTHLYFAIGLGITMIADSVIRPIRALLLLICRYLLVPLSILSILFAIMATSQFIRHHTTPLNDLSRYALITFSFLSILFINGIYQDGHSDKPYPHFIFLVCRLFLLLTPFFTGLVLYHLCFVGDAAIFNRGATTSYDYLTLVSIILLWVYTIFYAIMALRNDTPWFHAIQKINLRLAVVLIMATLIFENGFTLAYLKEKKLIVPEKNFSQLTTQIKTNPVSK